MDESWTLVINLAKTDTYILVQKSMLHLFPLISARHLNTQTNDHADIIVMIYYRYSTFRQFNECQAWSEY